MKPAIALLFTLVVVCSQAAFAVAPQLGQIMPRGAQRGAEVEFTFPGANLADATGVLFHDPGISLAAITAESDTVVKVRLTIAADCPAGLHAVRVVTRSGVSNLALLSIGDQVELAETEPNSLPEAANAVAMNNTVNGTVDSEDVDYYTVTLNAGDRLAVEVEALRLGGPLFDPKLRLFDPTNHELIAEDDTQLFRQDAGFIFTAKDAGPHQIAVSEASYGGAGNYHYRLHVGNFPRPLAVSPMGGAPGSTLNVTWLGDSGLSTQEIAVPNLPLGTGMLPVQSTGMEAPSPMPFRFSTLQQTLETEPNNDTATATVGTAAGAFDGIVGEKGDIDYYAFEGKAGQAFDVRLWGRALGSPLDSVVQVLKPDGAGIAGDDDAAGIDSTMRISLPEDGRYYIQVRDHLNRGGQTFSYRVEVTEVLPELSLSLLENRPVSTTVPQNNQTYLLVNASRRDFDGPLQVGIDGLPAGVSLQATPLPAGQTLVPVILTAAPDAAVGGQLLPLTAALQEEGRTLNGGLLQEVRLVDGRNDTTFYGRNVDKIAFAVADPAPYKVELLPQSLPMVQSSSRELQLKVTRAEGFAQPIAIRFPWLPPGMGGGTTTIAGDQTEATVRLEVRGETAPGSYTLFAAASSSGYELCTPLMPLEVQEPWVNFTVAEAEGEQGQVIELPVTLAQRTPFEGTSQLELLGLPKGVTAEPQPFTKESTEIRFKLTIAADSPEGKFGGIYATSQIGASGGTVLHNGGSGQVRVYAPLPAELQAAAPAPAPTEEQPKAEEERKTRFPTT
ncbi:MAG: pre-peptidase C-terminal domain-containing protein [Candidatus Hydrogenedentes bacterium]|nr:pre-peptidase C-terminal domain-containing protein [Candidatus Hydrogenedentota bacterium]